MKHTPGPWTDNHADYPGFVVAASGLRVANASTRDAFRAGGWPLMEANARLIAAAPDLLHACELAADCVDRFQGKLSPGATDRLRAAIRKATEG